MSINIDESLIDTSGDVAVNVIITTTATSNSVQQPLQSFAYIITRLPTEIVFEIYQHVPRRYIPEQLWQSQYFVNRWQARNISQTSQLSADGSTTTICRYEEGLLISKFDYDSHTQLPLTEENFRGGQAHGIYREWHDGSNIVRKQYSYVDGKITGLSTTYFANGQPYTQCYYQDDEPHGEQRGWYANGQPQRLSHYLNGSLFGPFIIYYNTPYTSKVSDNNSGGNSNSGNSNSDELTDRLWIQSNYVNDRLHGEHKTWSHEGVLVRHQLYSYGRLVTDYLIS